MYEEQFVVPKDADPAEPLYPWVDGLLPRPEILPFVERKVLRTERRFAMHELTICAKTTRIVDFPVVRGRWPTGQSTLILNEAFPLLAPWTCYILSDAFGGMLDEGEEVVVQGTAVPTYRGALTIPLTDGDLYQRIRRRKGQLKLDADHVDAAGWYEIGGQSIPTEIAVRYGGSLLARHPAELHDVLYAEAGEPRFSSRSDGKDEHQCPRCGTPTVHALLTQPENTLVCIGRLHLRAHDSDLAKNGGVLVSGTRISVWYASCGEVLDQGAATRMSSTPDGATTDIVSVDGQRFLAVQKQGDGATHGQYSYVRHIQRKVGKFWAVTPTARGFEEFVSNCLRETGALYFCQGDARKAEEYFYQLVYWTGKTCRMPLWRVISARIGLSIPDVCHTAARQLCGAETADPVTEQEGYIQQPGPILQGTLIAALRAKLRDRASQSVAQIEVVEAGVARYSGEARADRVILQTLAQFVSASLNVRLRNIGRSMLYSDTDERAVAAKNAVLNKLNTAARELGWPECEFREDRVQTGILFRKRDDVPSPALDSLECTRALFHTQKPPAADAAAESPIHDQTRGSSDAPRRPALVDFSQVVRIKRSRHAAAPPSPPDAAEPASKRPCPA